MVSRPQLTAGKKLRPMSNSCKELNAANNHVNLEVDPSPVESTDENTALTDVPIAALRGPGSAVSGLLILRYCETVSVCCVKLIILLHSSRSLIQLSFLGLSLLFSQK